MEQLYSSLHGVLPKAVLFTGFPNINPKITVPKNLVELGEELAISKCSNDEFLEKISITPEQSVHIEKITRGQNNDAWFNQRKGRITASIFHEVESKMDGLFNKKIRKSTPLISKILGASNNLENIPAIKYGRENEPVARQLFSSQESMKHRNFKVNLSGLIIKNDRPYIAGSPDGIVTCQCCPNSVLEIKCPISLKDKSPYEELQSINYFRLDDENNLILNNKHAYYSQIQGQMAVTGYKFGYFFVYSAVRSVTIKVDFDPKFWLQLQEKLTIFFKGYIVPYLLQIKQLSFCPMYNKVCFEVDEISNPVENSILCDCCSLWQHLKCAGITSPPKNNSSLVCSNCLLNAVDL